MCLLLILLALVMWMVMKALVPHLLYRIQNRQKKGFVDSNDNAADFEAVTPNLSYLVINLDCCIKFKLYFM